MHGNNIGSWFCDFYLQYKLLEGKSLDFQVKLYSAVLAELLMHHASINVKRPKNCG